MYGKFHASTFTGSMRGAGTAVFAVWGWVIANTNQHSVVELNPDIVAFLLGCTPEEVTAAVEVLCSTDPRSRCKDYDGRRLIKEGEYQYLVPTHSQYRAMQTTEEKREYNRVKKREERERNADVKPPVKNVKLVKTTEAVAKEEAKALTPPTPSESETQPPAATKSGVSEGKDSTNLPTTDQSRRIAALFRRRLTTPWTTKEIAAYRNIGTLDPRDLAALEKYYGANWPPCRDKNILRHDLVTLLNNIAGEIDRAHGANGKHTAPLQTRSNPGL